MGINIINNINGLCGINSFRNNKPWFIIPKIKIVEQKVKDKYNINTK